jgi:hypothetical protein
MKVRLATSNESKMDYNIINEQCAIMNKPLGKCFPDCRMVLSTFLGEGEPANENQLFYVEDRRMDTRQN